MAINNNALKLAKKVVRYARDINYPAIQGLLCSDCRHLPVQPVTGNCGHTRCINCIQQNGACYCGCLPPANLQINVFIQNLLNKMLTPETHVNCLDQPSTSRASVSLVLRSSQLSLHRRRSGHPYNAPFRPLSRRVFPSAEIQCAYAFGLVASGHRELAIPHLAHVAAFDLPQARRALDLMSQAIDQLLMTNNRDYLTRELYRAVRLTSVSSRLDLKDLECIVCYDTLEKPITTSCGHTFCRDCILRAIRYKKYCPVCRNQLSRIDMLLMSDTEFVNMAALAALPGPTMLLRTMGTLIPLVVCNVTFPTIPCLILILGQSYRITIERLFRNGQRRFGMIALYEDRTVPKHGTMLEIRDCVTQQDGQLLLTVIGVGRFKILELSNDVIYTAKVAHLSDSAPSMQEFIDRRFIELAIQITHRAINWLSTLSDPVMTNIEQFYGPMPMYYNEPMWWKNNNGPTWLWWIVAVLPVPPRIHVMLLSTSFLYKRMKAVLRILEKLNR